MGGRAVYVMRTLRALRHIGRVECVTCHVRRRKERGGGVSVGADVAVAASVEDEGSRSGIVCVGVVIFGKCSSVFLRVLDRVRWEEGVEWSEGGRWL